MPPRHTFQEEEGVSGVKDKALPSLGNLGPKFSEMSFPHFKTYLRKSTVVKFRQQFKTLDSNNFTLSSMFSLQYAWPIKRKVYCILACENICFSSLFATGDVSRGGTPVTQRQKFHTDDANQCLHNESGSHEVPNINLSNFACLLVDFGDVLCSSANELHQNSNTSSREDYIPEILTVLLQILLVYI